MTTAEAIQTAPASPPAPTPSSSREDIDRWALETLRGTSTAAPASVAGTDLAARAATMAGRHREAQPQAAAVLDAVRNAGTPATPAPAPAKPAGDATTAKPADGAGQTTPTDPIALVEYRRALARTGVYTREEIDALPEAALIAKGTKAREMQRATDAAFQAAKKRGNTDAPGAEGTKPDDAPTTRSGSAGGHRPQPSADPATEGSDEWLAALESLDPDAAQQARTQLASAQAVQAEAQRTIAKTKLDAARSELVKDFPEMSKLESFQTVLATMNRIEGAADIVFGGTDAQIAELMRDAASVVYHRAQVAAREKAGRVQATLNGMPDTGPSDVGREVTGMDVDDYEAVALRTLRSAGSLPAAQASMAGVQLRPRSR